MNLNPFPLDYSYNFYFISLCTTRVTVVKLPLFVQTQINMSQSSTLWNIASDIYKITLFSTFRANIRWFGSRNRKSAFITLPISETTLGADISSKPAVGSVATKSACPFYLFLFQFSLPPFKKRSKNYAEAHSNANTVVLWH